MRLDGREVMFLTGTDEHGQKVQASALKAGRSPQQFCDEVSQEFRRVYMEMCQVHDTAAVQGGVKLRPQSIDVHHFKRSFYDTRCWFVYA